MLALLRRQHAYTRWANASLLAATPEAASDALALLGHVLGSEQIWLERLARGQAQPRELFAARPRAELERELDELAQRWQDYWQRLREPELARACEYRRFDGSPSTSAVFDILTHVVTHGAYHRGQLASQLRAAGIAVPPTD